MQLFYILLPSCVYYITLFTLSIIHKDTLSTQKSAQAYSPGFGLQAKRMLMLELYRHTLCSICEVRSYDVLPDESLLLDH